MAVESATYLSELVDTNPPSSDNVSQGDDHLRLLKTVLQNTFPSINGVWTAVTHTFSVQQIFSLSSSGAVPIELVSTNADASNGPILSLYRNSASVADADGIGGIYVYGKDESGNKQLYGTITYRIDDATHGTEDGTWLFNTVVGADNQTHWQIGNGVATRGLTPQGSGTVNASDYYNDNTRMCDATVASFSAHKNGTAQTSVSSGTKITFATELFDVGSLYTAGSSRWTPPAGTAIISVCFETIPNDQSSVGVLLYKNGNPFKAGAVAQASNSGGATLRVATTWIVETNGTDYWEVFYNGGTTETIEGDAVVTWFAGSML